MATLTAKITLTSANATSDALNLSVSGTLTTTNPSINIARASVSHSGVTTFIASSVSEVNYVYLKNIDTTNYIDVRTDGATGMIRLAAGEFAFFPLMGSTGLECQANTAACVLEYAYFTKG